MGYTATPNPKYDVDSGDEDLDEDENVNAQKKANKPKNKKKTKEKKFNKIQMLSDEELIKNKHNNFYILSSVNIFDQPIDVTTKKQILTNFNSRPDNINGKKVSFYSYGTVVLKKVSIYYDIKYIHIFEPQTTLADKKQVIGRGTRNMWTKRFEIPSV